MDARFEPGSFSPSRRRVRSLDERIALILLGLVIVGAPQLLGGVAPWAIVLIAVCALLALLATCYATRDAPSLPTPWLIAMMCAACMWTALQALPLPCGLIAALAPESAAHQRAGLNLLGDGSPSLCALSRDPGATQQEIIKGIAIVATFCAAFMWAARRRGEVVITLVAWSTLLMSGIALAHGALGLDRVLGFYEPTDVRRELLLAPLVNPNSIGGFALLGVPIWFFAARRARRLSTRVLAHAALVINSVAVVLSMSRGAISALLAALLFAMLAGMRRAPRAGAPDSEKRKRRSLGTVGAGAAAAIGIGLATFTLSNRLVGVDTGGLDKLELIASAFRLSVDNFFVGVGRGAFSSAFARVRGGASRYEYAESFVAQWASEWGWPVTLVLLAAIVHALWRALRRRVSGERLGAAIGVIALACQNLVDLSFELLGVAVVVAAAFAVAVAPRMNAVAALPSGPGLALRDRSFALGLCALGVVALLALGPRLSGNERGALEHALRSELHEKDPTAFRSSLARAVRLHPSEPTFAVLAAAHGLLRDDTNAARWINRALLLAPTWATPHAQAFEWLWRGGRHEQALLELRIAAEMDAAVVAPIVCALAKDQPKAVLQSAPHGATRRSVLESAANCAPWESAASPILDDVLLSEFGEVSARQRHAWRLRSAGKIDEALTELDRAYAAAPGRAQTLWARAVILLDADRPLEAANAAQKGLARAEPGERRSLLELQARAYARLRDDNRQNAALEQLRAAARSDPEQLAQAFRLEGDLERARGRLGRAARAFHDAYNINDDTSSLRAIAEIEEEVGNRHQAAHFYGRLCDVAGDAAACRQRDALRAQR